MTTQIEKLRGFQFFAFLHSSLKAMLCALYGPIFSRGFFANIRLKSQSERHQGTFLSHTMAQPTQVLKYIV